jgi:hypothetical protein
MQRHRSTTHSFAHCLSTVMPGFMPGIHVFPVLISSKTWMAGTSPAMTTRNVNAPQDGFKWGKAQWSGAPQATKAA